jgi:hypothetical protein
MVDINALNVSTTMILVLLPVANAEEKLMLGFVQPPVNIRAIAEESIRRQIALDRLLNGMISISRLMVLNVGFKTGIFSPFPQYLPDLELTLRPLDDWEPVLELRGKSIFLKID